MTNLVAHWDRRAESYDATPGNSLSPEQAAAWGALLAEVYPVHTGRLLDIGCGTGTYSLLIAELGFDVHGVDTSERMVERARAKALERGAGPGVSFSTLPAQDISGQYDAVFSRNVLWTVADPGRLAETVREHTTESAVWIAVETMWDGHPRGDFREAGKDLPGFGGWHPNVLRDVFTRHGFARTTWSSISNRPDLATQDRDVHVLFRVSR
ncbi:class I SAM-dependent methyltransferase [Streptomyces sp. SID7499]|uniref:Class I SAM-dependent methyltransferase n=2 Tax=unclassified Streptomyces TaxID=2593676 RepID=A0A6G3X8P4_9ACTN|nr:SAM-dependent methyltransferase [Streptomyces sp. MK730-62F2]NEE14175.1 class I SAM-dependent methyltransferase [Streptomyces sp. SID7499]